MILKKESDGILDTHADRSACSNCSSDGLITDGSDYCLQGRFLHSCVSLSFASTGLISRYTAQSVI